MKLIPKQGDKVYCINDFYDFDNTLVMKMNNVYMVHFVYKQKGIESLVSIESNGFFYTLNLKNAYGWNYYEYFMSIKEYRKMKLEKLFIECQ